MGIKSPGTLKEVFRGYIGDKNAPQIFSNEDTIASCFGFSFKASFFSLAGGSGFQRPFEMATKRLLNMIEVINNWTSYFPYDKYLTQRGATFLCDNNNILYKHLNKSILGFSDTMSDPLSYISVSYTHLRAHET